MSSPAYKPAKLFTIEQANAMLPLVRAITSDLSGLAQDVVQRRHRLAHFGGGRDFNSGELKPGDLYAEELAHMQAQIDKDQQRLQDYVKELYDLGVEPKGAIEGLVDFPSAVDGRVVFLCWKLGEPEVLYWHDVDAGFAGRQPLTAGSVAADPFDSYGHESDESLGA